MKIHRDSFLATTCGAARQRGMDVIAMGRRSRDWIVDHLEPFIERRDADGDLAELYRVKRCAELALVGTATCDPALVEYAWAAVGHGQDIARLLGERWTWPSRDEARAFVADYEAARGRPFTGAERRRLDAAAIHAMTYTARCEHGTGAPFRPMGDALAAAPDAYLCGS